jgi:hypothetical protein
MKLLNAALIIVLIAISLVSCNTQTTDNSESTNLESENMKIYYFHLTKRCATCNAVENETKMTLESFFSEKLKNGEIEFISLNIEEEKSKDIAKDLDISGQALLIVKGNKKVNLINEGFMNARTNPDKFHDILKSQIDNLL